MWTLGPCASIYYRTLTSTVIDRRALWYLRPRVHIHILKDVKDRKDPDDQDAPSSKKKVGELSF